MSDTEILQLRAVLRWLERAENILARFDDAPMNGALESANEACSKIEYATDEIRKMLPEDKL